MKIRIAALALTLLFTIDAVAHHSEAAFDQDQIVSVSGTVKEYLWVNPHVRIYLEVSDARGRSDVTVFQGGPPVDMERRVWSRDSVKAGDKLTITYHPRRDKKPGGMLVTATLANGKVLGWQSATMP